MIALKVENLSKAYQIGQFTTGTLSLDIERWWALMRGKEDPFLKIGETNDRSLKGESDIVWSLKDLNFEIAQGEAIGIIGKNGAGKSTLLKILSQVTTPTTGIVRMKGRVASLLEVGTGFHPELTGRENIFLNGAILGMRKAEIIRKFDEIVDFSGVERYIDTPVKRYSSGMYVRLAFSVAAHLESEILVVDEVLSVGDAEFQKKCMGKMGEINKGEGRTVLFVSHMLQSIKNLCPKTLLLNNGGIVQFGETITTMQKYLEVKKSTKRKWGQNEISNHVVELLDAQIVDHDGYTVSEIDFLKGGGIQFTFRVKEEGHKLVPNIHVFDQHETNVFSNGYEDDSMVYNKGVFSATIWLIGNLLNAGYYTAGIAVSEKGSSQFYVRNGLTFEVHEDTSKRDISYLGPIPGTVRPKLDWKVIRL